MKALDPYRWIAAIALIALAIWGVTAAYKSHANGLREEGRSGLQAEQSAALNRTLLNHAEGVATLSNQLQEALNAYTITANAVAGALADAGTRGERVRSAITPGGELDQRFARAECAVARSVGADAFRTAKACRDDVAAIGLGPGGLVESSASAHYEHDRADALMRFAMPKSPFIKPTEKRP